MHGLTCSEDAHILNEQELLVFNNEAFFES